MNNLLDLRMTDEQVGALLEMDEAYIDAMQPEIKARREREAEAAKQRSRSRSRK